jgi:hypothetical protein
MELKTPHNYFELEQDQKLEICVGILETMYEMVLRMSKNSKFSNVEVMEKIIETTLEFNENLEEYEVCAVLKDTKDLLDDHRNY